MTVYATKVKETVKKARTPKQLAADAKNAETRRMKKEAKDKENLAVANLEEEKAAAVVAKKALQAAKRKEKRDAKKMDEAVEEAIKKPKLETTLPPKPKAVVLESKLKTEDQLDKPPVWFESYLQTRAKEDNKSSEEKRPQKQVASETKVESAKQWADPPTRKVVSQLEGKMDKMYRKSFLMAGMMFSR